MAPLLETARRVRPGARAIVAIVALLLGAGTLTSLTDMAHAEPAAVVGVDEHGAHTPAVQAAPVVQAAPAVQAAPTVIEAAPASHRALRALLPILVLLVLATGLLVLDLRRRRRAHPTRQSPGPARALTPTSRAPLATAEGVYEASTAHAGGGGELGIVGTSSVTVVPGLVDPSQHRDDGYDDHDDLLEPFGARVRPDDSLDTTTAQMVCAECERGFEMGTRFCPFDGELLHMQESQRPAAHHDAGDDEVVMLCPCCDTQYESGAVYCSKDQTRLVARSQDESIPDYLSAAPMVVCTHCAREFRVGQDACPDCGDDSELRFMHGRTTRGLWVDSPPFTQICPECGSRYSDELSHCAHDGAALVRLN